MARRKVKNGEKSSSRRSLLFFVAYFSARLDFPSPPLSAPGSPRMGLFQSLYTYLFEHNKVVKNRSDLPKNNFIQFQSPSGYLILEYPF